MLNVNYYDAQLEIAGYPHVKGENGELFFSKAEERWCQEKLRKYRGKYKVLWSLSGSSFHKTYPFGQNVCDIFLSLHKDAVVFLTGSFKDLLLTWEHPQVKDLVDIWTLRQVLCAIKYMDLVVAPETGILNAAGCYDVPKIAFLSHSSVENLTKYFRNCTNLHGDVECYPCHRLIYQRIECPIDPITLGPICMSRLKARDILDAMESWYYKEAKCSSPT
jgi:ADP-heptose:LPS heptosyltransferase